MCSYRHTNFVYFWVRSDNCEKRLLASLGLAIRLSGRPSTWNNSDPTGRILMKFGIWIFLKICGVISSFINIWQEWWYFTWRPIYIFDHHHHVLEVLGILSCSLILKMKLVPPSLPRSSYVLRPFGLYCSACFGSLFVSILCTCCSHVSSSFWFIL